MTRIWIIVIGIFCAALVGGLLVPTLLAGELTEAEFHRLHEQLQPAPDEPWRTIPWKIALLDAQ